MRQTEKIINVLCSRTDAFQSLQYKQTKKGELRLDKCRKYDLGSGYRLITMQWREYVFLVYAGTHDECNLWLQKQKNTTLNIASLANSSTILPVARCQFPAERNPPISEVIDEPDPLEKDLLSRIDEKTLRSVFSGLCQSK